MKEIYAGYETLIGHVSICHVSANRFSQTGEILTGKSPASRQEENK
jgi:hypothetical protein